MGGTKSVIPNLITSWIPEGPTSSIEEEQGD